MRKQGWGGPGVTAAVWGKALSESPQTPTGRPYPSATPAGPEGPECARRCVGGGPLRVAQTPTGRPYPSAVPARPEGLGRNRRCAGRDPSQLSSALGVPLSLRGPGKTGGTRHDRHCVREGPLRVPSQPPRGDPIPARPRQDRRDSGVTAAVWGRDLPVCHPKPPTGRPYPSMARAGPGGLGCNRRCMGGDFPVCP